MAIISVVQMTSSADLDQNLAVVAELLAKAAAEQSRLVVLPENFPLMTDDEQGKLHIRESYGQGKIQDFLAEQARKNKLWIVGGTIPIISADENRVRAACIVYDDQGIAVARYDKIHLFDVSIAQGTEIYHESQAIEPGQQITVLDTPVGRLGIAICYDLRFPELFRQMLNNGMEVLAVPAAFTEKTGQAHWEALIRARAIENLCYGAFSCQTGKHFGKRVTYGHSSLIDPWGKILKQITSEVGVISANIDLDYLKEIRQNFPVKDHQRIFTTR